MKIQIARFSAHQNGKVFGVLIGALALAWPVLALADCVDMRKPTAAEVDFHNRAIAALVASLPPVPVGGKLQNPDRVPTLGQQCQGMTGDFALEASRFYELNSRLAIVEMAMNVMRLPAADPVLVTTYGSASPKRSAGLKVNNIMSRVSGSDSPLRKALAEGIDRTRLEAMVGKPLPSVAESQALAASAVPATVGATPSSPAAAAPSASGTATQPTTPASPSAPASGQAGASDTTKDAVDTVNKLRGLFGR